MLVRGFAVTKENYELVLECLKRKYDQKEGLRAILYKQSQMLQPTSKTRDFCKVFEKFECILRQLEPVGENFEHSRIEFLLEEKLSSWVLESLLS